MLVRQLRVGPLDVFAYVVACEQERRAVLIDPAAEVDRILDQVKEDGLKVELIVNTHGHPDHTSGNAEAKALTGASIGAHRSIGESLGSLFNKAMAMMTGGKPSPAADLLLDDGDVIEVGSIKLKVLHTPGHTRGDICLHGSGAVFTGDVLFVGGVGRTDLPGGSTVQLQQSIRKKLLTLDDETVVYPGHDYGPTPTSTIARERWENPYI